VTEPTPPAIPLGICGREVGAYWDTTISPAQPMPITAGPNTVTVTNTLRCNPSLSVTKTFVDATGSPIQIQPPAFNIKVTCSPLAISATNLSLTPPATATSSSVPWLVQNVPVGSGETCTVTESGPPAIPIAAQRICGSNIAAWDWPPAYTPQQMIPISATGQNAVNVTNTLRCKIPPPTKFEIIKDMVDMTPGGTNHPASPYSVTLGCTPASTPANLPLTVGTPAGIVVPLGANCTPNETLPPVPPAAIQACAIAGAVGTAHWETPAFVPPSFTVTSAGPQIVHVIDVLRCGIKDSPGTLTVLKQVSGPAGIVPPPTAFSLSVKCGTQPPTPMTLSANAMQTVVATQPNCTVSESPPSPLTFSAPGCGTGVATWLTPPTYAPSSSVMVYYGMAAAVVATNSYACVPGINVH
jgi:hypothetical protein